MDWGDTEVPSPQTAVGLTPGDPIQHVAAGWDFTVAITASGKILCCGSNAFGQLGGCTAVKNRAVSFVCPHELAGTVVRQASCGLRHTVILTDDGRVLTTGSGRHGQLGLHSPDGAPVSKTTTFHQVVLPGGHGRPIKVVAGSQHTAVLTDTGQLIVWGANKHGQLAFDPSECSQVTVPRPISQTLLLGAKVKDIHSGWTHMLAVTDAGCVYTWGRGDYGQTGHSGPPQSSWQPARLGLTDPLSVCCGAEHNLLVTGTGQLYSWGWNEHGMCGTGDEVNVVEPTLVAALEDKYIHSVASGAGHCFAVCSQR